LVYRLQPAGVLQLPQRNKWNKTTKQHRFSKRWSTGFSRRAYENALFSDPPAEAGTPTHTNR
ncbi:MAG: hypothetical protein Q8M16_03465, partial [Pirellulaceae bacterium]|nr:hypothetical protein [Pirellulaceae bacterium]